MQIQKQVGFPYPGIESCMQLRVPQFVVTTGLQLGLTLSPCDYGTRQTLLLSVCFFLFKVGIGNGFLKRRFYKLLGIRPLCEARVACKALQKQNIQQSAPLLSSLGWHLHPPPYHLSPVPASSLSSLLSFRLLILLISHFFIFF